MKAKNKDQKNSGKVHHHGGADHLITGSSPLPVLNGIRNRLTAAQFERLAMVCDIFQATSVELRPADPLIYDGPALDETEQALLQA